MQFTKDILSHPRGAVGLISLFSLLLLSLFSPFIVPYDPTEFHLLHKFVGPSAQFWFGTDQYGRDTLSRVLIGSRYTFALGLGSTLIAMIFGIVIGIFSGYVGRSLDGVIMRLNDAILSIPALLLALIIVATLGSSLINAMLAIGLAFIPRVTRIVRSATLDVKHARFIDAARARGESIAYIIFREILPNTWGTILIEGTYRFGFAVFTGASLSFLGLGVQPPNPEWGLMIRMANGHMLLSPWPLIFPVIFIIVAIVSANLLGDRLSELLGSKKGRMT